MRKNITKFLLQTDNRILLLLITHNSLVTSFQKGSLKKLLLSRLSSLISYNILIQNFCLYLSQMLRWLKNRSGAQEIEFQEIEIFLIRRSKLLSNDQEIESFFLAIFFNVGSREKFSFHKYLNR